MSVNLIDVGTVDYDVMHARQLADFKAMVARKQQRLTVDEEKIYFVEHPAVITLGRHANEANLLLNEAVLAKRGINVVHTERGGDITFHGPGQLVVYPLIDLSKRRLGIRDYINLLEECVIATLRQFGISGERIPGATGVWLDKGSVRERKICAIGVRSSRYITMHGLALNVNTDLSYFSMINPCGFTDKGVTSIARELGAPAEMDRVKSLMRTELFARL